ncbi:MAG: hypothetical protein OHK0046_00970 [Anaerolineae bacterium]
MRTWFNLRLALLLLLLLVLTGELTAYLQANPRFDVLDFVGVFIRNIQSEALTVAISVVLVELLRRRHHTQHERQMLMTQLGSPNAVFASEAARVLRARGWLVDGALRRAFLAQANLEGVQLWSADLAEAELMESNLCEANLHRANLEGAALWGANLRGAEMMAARLHKANLRKADLSSAKLWQADFSEAVLEHADLRGANLRNANLRHALLQRASLEGATFLKANLQGADLSHARFDTTTILPDGSAWSPEVDMGRFTNPQHAHFWRPGFDDSDPPTWYRVAEVD